MSQLFNLDDVYALADLRGVLYLLLVLVILFVAKLVHGVLAGYKLDEELTGKNNKAVALGFGGYLFGVAIILYYLMDDSPAVAPEEGYWRALGSDLLSTAIWGGIGILFLQLACLINGKVLLYRFSTRKELVEDQNVGTGAIQCGAYIGSALIVAAALSGGEERGFLNELMLTAIYFFSGQVSFVVFAFFYDLCTPYGLHDEIEKDNVAVGVSFGLTLGAIGLLLSSYILTSDSLIGLAVWFVLCAVVLITLRFLVDRFILPGDSLDSEISEDRNWGAALIEGGTALGIAFVMAATL